MNEPLKRAILILQAMAGVLALGVCPGCQHAASDQRNATSPTFRVMTFNIHHGEGLDGKVDLERIALLIRNERADLVALQEVDKGVRRTGQRDLPAELADLTGMACVFSNNFHFQGGEYGNAILSRFPVLSATNSHYQMLRTNEQRCLLQVTVAAPGRQFVFASTHIDYRRENAERLLNVGQIQSLLGPQTELPVVLCGDFNDSPGSKVHQALKQSFDDAWELATPAAGWTYPAANPQKRIDYVWVSRSARLRVLDARVLESTASDHRPVIVALQFE